MRHPKMLVAVAMLVVASGASAAGSPAPATGHTPMVQDWSTRQVAFRNAETPEQARAKGRYAQWQQLASDPRYMHALAGKLQADSDRAAEAKLAPGARARPRAQALHRDWSNVMGGGPAGTGGSGIAGVYPAKFSFDINAVPTCNFDFVVFPTGSPGHTLSGTREKWGSSFRSAHSVGSLRVGKFPPRSVTIFTSSTVNDGVFAKTLGPDITSAASTAANLAAAVNRWTGQTGFSAVAETNQVVISSDTAGNQDIDAVEENLTNFGPWVNQDGLPDPGQPSLIAFNYLYDVTCTPTRRDPLFPNVLFSYNTGGAVRTSPVLSYYDNGRQIAFVQSVGGQAELVILKWYDTANGLDAARPRVPATAANATEYRNEDGPCVVEEGCMIKFPLGADDSWSSPFVDYGRDTLYVGSDDGVLHKFTGVFRGLPTRVTTGGFPATVSPGNALSSPVYNFAGSVFVGSASSVGSGGALHRVNSSTGVVVSSAKLTADSVNPGLRESPMVDGSTGRVYVSLFNDGGATGTNCTVAPCRAVVDFAGTFPAGATGNKVRIGSGNSTTKVQYNGTFDSAWADSVDSTGAMYVCGGIPGDPVHSALWKVPVTAGVLGTPVKGATVTTGSGDADCSPVTIVRNGINEYLYFSVTDHGTDGATGVCLGPCVYLYNLHALAPEAQEHWTFDFTANQTVAGGTLVVDGTTLTAGTVQGCPTFSIANSASQDAARLAACVDNVPGYSGNRAQSRVVITRLSFGDVPDNTVHEGIDMVNFSEIVADHVNGSDPSVWAPTNVPVAGITALGGAGGIIIDNISSLPGASRIYYGNLGPVTGNAIQTSQSDLD